MIFRFTLSYSDQPTSFPTLSEFTNADPGNEAWTTGANPSVTPTTSKLLKGEIAGGVQDVEYQIDFDIDIAGLTGGAHNLLVRIRLYDSSFTTFEDATTAVFFTNGNKTGFVNLIPSFVPVYIVFLALQSSGSGASVTINSYNGSSDAVVTDSLVISEPEGWADAVLKLERDENFHSLIEHFEGDFIFYGDNGIQNGGIDFIKYVESNYGPDADLEILIEISFNGYTYEQVFSGLLDLSTIVEMKDNLLQCAIIRNDFWTKFITRQETQVDLQSFTDVDGNPVTVHDSANLSMLPQLLRERSDHTETLCYQVLDSEISVNEYIQIDFDTVVFNEIRSKFNYPITSNPTRPFELFAVEFGGDYTFDVRVVFAARSDYLGLGLNWAASLDGGGIAQNPIIEVYIQVNDDTPIAFTYDSIDPDVIHPYSYNGTLTLNKGDFVRIYALLTRKNTPGTGSYWIIGSTLPADINTGVGSSIDDGQDTHLYVTANTIFPTSNSEGFLIHDAAAHICDRIIGRENTFYSEYLGGLLTLALQYGSDGCAWFYMLLKGLQIRQYSLLEKPFFMSFRQWWEGANPILNLGLGYETLDAGPADAPTVDSFANEQLLGSGDDWGINLGPLRYSCTPGLSDLSKLLAFEIFGGLTDVDYHIGYNLTCSDAGAITISLYNSALTSSVDSTVLFGGGGGTQTGTKILTPSFIPKYVTFRTSFGDGVTVFDVEPFTFSVEGIPDPDPIEVIRVEEKAHFYQNEITVNFSNVREISRMYDHDYYFNNVETGYKKWQSEDVSGIDDPQTKRTWASRFKKLGKKISILSDFIAAGLTIEKTRRTTREKSADYKYDNDVFIIAINPVPVDISPETSPDVVDYEPELDENFTSVTNINNPDSRYNLRLTPGRNLLRWLNYISGCLQNYVTSFFKFSSGEGNYDMRSTMTDTSPDCNDPADYAGAQLSEKGDIRVGTDYLFIPIPIEISIPMEWEEYKLIDRKKAIGISQTTDNHEAFFIKTLEYKIAQGTATGVLWPKDVFALSIITDVPQTDVCIPVEAQECGILLENGELMLTESGELMILEEC